MSTASFHLPGAGTYPLQSFGGAVLTNVTINTGAGGGGVVLYDAVNGTTTSIANISASSPVALAYNTKLNHGLTAVVTGAVDLTVTVSSSPIGSAGGGSQQSGSSALPAGSFSVATYGAKGDGQVVNDGAISSTVNTTTLACATSTPFTPADVLKYILVEGAGPAGVTILSAQITAYVDPGHVTLSVAASTTVTGATVLWASDDTAAFQAAVNAANTYALAHSGNGKIVVPQPANAFYGIAGPLSHANLGNGQITLPVAAVTGDCITLEFEGASTANAIRHWLQTTPQVTGSTLVSFGVYSSISAQVNDINANGQGAVISGPTGPNGYGTATFLFSNMNVVIKNLNIVTPYSSFGLGYSGVWLWGCDQTNMSDSAVNTTAVFNNGSGELGSISGLASGASIAIGLPATSNQNNVTLDRVTIGGGYTYGILATEHSVLNGCHIFYCWAGLCPVGSWHDGGGGVTANTSSHKIRFPQTGIEGCVHSVFVLGAGAGGVGPFMEGSVDSEGGVAWADDGHGGLAAAVGEVHLTGTSGGTLTTSTNTALTIIDERKASGIGTPWVLSVGTAFQNTQWRWASVLVKGGTSLTDVLLGTGTAARGGASAPTMGSIYNQASGVLPLVPVRVPPGGWLQVNGTGSAPTTTVVYD